MLAIWRAWKSSKHCSGVNDMAEQHGKALVPQIRFAGFTDPWEQRKLGEVARRVTRKNENGDSDLPLTISAQYGLVDQRTFFNSQVASKDMSGYFLLHRGEFAYNKSTSADSPWGAIKRLEKYDMGCVSTLYICFELLSGDPDFLVTYYETDRWYKAVQLIAAEGARNHGLLNIAPDDFFETQICIPKRIDEQCRIGAVFNRLDSLITLHQRKYDKLCVLKKSMLDKMFPKGGSMYPEIRFAGFTDPWEQRKLSELVEIERGGSPRPIERYITDDPCGLNWVKIGDAPELGRYITQTTEKIKPEGLAKTRQVYPGDLVLSNSMSFGRPYIMAIKGCIHDGWLLIRDAQKHFDPIFLCHMLGAPQMLNQYRMFAAGSTVNNLNKELVGKAIVSLPSKDEQREIGIVFDRLDSLITLHQRKLELLRNIKKSMLDKMFV